jgi:O-antigen ligase
VISKKSWIIFIFCFSIVAVFTSQTAVDLADFLLIITGLTIGIRNKELKSLFANFKPALLWPIWILVLTTGMIINVGFQDFKSWNDFFEFRWILTFLSIIYLGSKIHVDESFIKLFAGIILILNLVAIILFIQDSNWRAQGIIEATMAFSHNIAPLFCLFMVFLVTRWEGTNLQNKIFLSVVTLTSGLLTLFTYTRGVWIGSIAAMTIVLFYWNKKRAIVLVAIGVVLAVTLLESNKRVNERAFGKTNNETQSNNERIALWRGNWAMIQDYPLFGVGIGQNKYHLRKYYDEMGYPQGQRESHAHNQFLQMWAGTGIFGLILFLIFNGLIVKNIKDSLNHLRGTSKSFQLGLLAAVVCFMIGALTESNFNIAKNRLLFLILAGLAVSQAIKEKQKT